MARITWLGESEICREGETPPAFTTWNGIVFRVSEPVEIDDPHMIAKAKGNRFFCVSDDTYTTIVFDNSRNDMSTTITANDGRECAPIEGPPVKRPRGNPNWVKGMKRNGNL